jgi:D-mannonate dehydratase
VVETIQYFGGRKKLFKVHFRNVSATLPHFTEATLDDPSPGLAYLLGGMNAMLKAAQSKG